MSEVGALTLFVHIAGIVVAAAVVTVLLRCFKQPNLFAYIIAGVFIGPLVLGGFEIVFGGHKFVLGIPAITGEIKLLSTLGIAFLLFSIGTETSIKRLLSIGRSLFIGTLLQVFLVIVVTFLLTVPFNLLSMEQALFVGVIVAFSSTMLVVKIFSDRNEINTLDGRVMVSILLLQDVMVFFFYPILMNIHSINSIDFFGLIILKTLLFIVIALVANRFIFPRLFESAVVEQELFYLLSIATAFIFIGISFLLDLPMPIGAFIGGLALSTLPYNSEIFARVRALRDFFLTIFFVSLGVQLSFDFGSLPLALMLVIVLIIFLVKPIILFLITLFSGYGVKLATKVGISLGQVSEFGFEIAGVGLITLTAAGTPVLPAGLFTFIITIIAVSMIITPYLTDPSSKVAKIIYDFAEHLSKSFKSKYFRRKIDELEATPSKRLLKDHIIIFGGGTVGRGLAKALVSSNQVLVVDHDPEVVKQGIKDGLPYVYGTSESNMLWDRLDLKQAKLVVITIVDAVEAIKVVKAAKKHSKNITVFATAHYFSDTFNLYKNDVDFVAMPSVMGSNVFLENITRFIETGKLLFVQNYMQEYLSYLKDKVEEEKKYRKEAPKSVH